MNELDQYLNARAYEITDTFVDIHKDEVLEYMLLRGVTYATEISRITGLHIDTVNRILNQLRRLGYISNFIVDCDNPQRIFIPRLLELWARNVWGAERISSYSWWIITEAGFEYFKTKYTGKGKKVIKSLVTHYDWFLLEPIENIIIPKEIKEIICSDILLESDTDNKLQVEGGNPVSTQS